MLPSLPCTGLYLFRGLQLLLLVSLVLIPGLLFLPRAGVPAVQCLLAAAGFLISL